MPIDINTAFTRRLLTLMHDDVRRAFPGINGLMQIASVTHSLRDQYFVEIDDVPGVALPHPFSIDVRAGDAYEARYKAWSTFLAKHAPAEFHDEVMRRREARR
jgi:hypothetical protein